jgi:hypothetical protein
VQQKLISRWVSVISAGKAFGLRLNGLKSLLESTKQSTSKARQEFIGVRISQQQQASGRVDIVDGAVI